MSSHESVSRPRLQRYSDVAPPTIPVPTCRRRDRVLFTLRSASEPVTAAELVEHLRRNRMRDYNRGLAYNDLNALERYGFVRSKGRPARWEAK